MFCVCRVDMDQDEPLTLRLLLWLNEDTFLAVVYGKSLSRILKLTPSDTLKDTLEIRYYKNVMHLLSRPH